ncbi:glycosyl hydrolase family 28-related protein [Roseococcus sp. YIM B11640]|uniref:glycosyl hydrolase family 28-related protein n=1 Tax=Roseococcus sp. YIM B11640 TaxID=3133973 RepID=UPI003C7D5585
MPDLKISELPAATSLADSDLTPLVQTSPALTKRATLLQLRRSVLADRGVDVRDYGAVGDGSTNDAPAIQAAINALGSAGGVVQLGARAYRLMSPITVTNGAVRLQGAGYNEGGNPGDGTWLCVYETGFTPITFTGTAARGSVVKDLAVRQSHTAAQNASWAPANYDYVFKVVNCFGGVDFDNILFSGVNRGIYSRNSGRCDFRRIRGQVFTTAIEIDECYDAARMHNLHLWPYWSSNDHVVHWQQANGDALVFRRCDGVFVDQAFALGYRSMFCFTSSAAGYTQKFSIGQAYADFVKHGLWIDTANTDGQIDSMTVQGEIFNGFGAPLPGAIGIYIASSGTRVQIGSLRVDDAEDNSIRIEAHSNRLDIGSLRCVNYNQRNTGAAAIHLANAATGVPNRVNLGSPPLLETAIPGPVVNAGTNGSVGSFGPDGEAARPGVAVGRTDTGLFRPAAGGLSLSSGGVEVMRATSGTLSLGAAPGSNALEVTTPANAVNRMEIRGAATGSPALVGWIATGSDANLTAVIGQPKGTGSIQAQFTDGTAAGGNARGSIATDWQTSRTNAAMVASGASSTIGGGVNNRAAGGNATVAGGSGNSAINGNCTIAGGSGNTTAASGATVAGGVSNTADGNSAWIPGGTQATARGRSGVGVWSAGNFATVGDAQSAEALLRRITTDATPTRLTADNAAQGSANTLNLPNNGTYMARIRVVAQQTAGSAGTTGDCAGWEMTALIRRGASAAATTLVGSSGTSVGPTHADGGAAAWRVGIAADTANGALALTATGEASKTIRWVARVLSVETTA